MEQYARDHGSSNKELLLYQHPGADGATALHTALHRNSWGVAENVRLLLGSAPELASIPMRSKNVYPLHVLCHHYDSLLLRKDDKHQLLAMILKACPQAACARDCNGDMPLQVLFTRNSQQQHLLLKPALRLAQAAVENHGIPLTWYALCMMPRCPPSFLRMLLLQSFSAANSGLFMGDFRRPNPATGRLPLHAAAAAEVVRNDNGASLLQVVLQADPTAATRYDNRGRLPLHDAVSNPTLDPSSILLLARAHPDALAVPDPISGLFPFMAIAATTKDQDAVNEILRMDPTVCHNNHHHDTM